MCTKYIVELLFLQCNTRFLLQSKYTINPENPRIAENINKNFVGNLIF